MCCWLFGVLVVVHSVFVLWLVLLRVVCCVLFVVCRVAFDVCCLLCMVCSLLFLDVRSLFGVFSGQCELSCGGCR